MRLTSESWFQPSLIDDLFHLHFELVKKSKFLQPRHLFPHQQRKMNHIRKRVVNKVVRPDAVPFLGEFSTLRFIEVDGEVAVESFGERGRLICSAGEYL